MAHQVVMPQMGESIAEGTLTNWLKKVGDTVAQDEPLFEIATDKVDAEIPSPVAGTLLEIKVEPGSTVPIDTVVAVIGAADEAGAGKPADKAAKAGAPKAAAAPPPAQAAPTAPPAPAPAAPVPAASPGAADPSGRGPKASPLVRKMAQVHQVDLQDLAGRGSGQGGRVTKQDMVDHLAGAGAPAPSPTAPGPAPSAPRAQPVGGNLVATAGELPEAYRPRVFAGDKVEDLSGMRQKIAEHMVISRRISAHVATVWEADFTHVAALRQKHKRAWADRHGVNITYTAFIMKAAVDALKAFPALNASLDGNKVIYHQAVNLGMAVALDWGLIVPVIHGADELNLLGIARRMADLAARARTKKLKPDEVSGGTFTVSNPGGLGPMFNVPVINQPQVAIMGVGTVERRPVVIDEMIAIRTRAYLSLSFDHRLIDGALADQFMAKVKEGIETFDAAAL